MPNRINSIALAAAIGTLAGCISTAEGILDSVAGSVANVGSSALFNVDEEACRADPFLLASKGVALEFYMQKSFNLASDKCKAQFGVDINQATFESDYALNAADYCTSSNGNPIASTYCTQTLSLIHI